MKEVHITLDAHTKLNSKGLKIVEEAWERVANSHQNSNLVKEIVVHEVCMARPAKDGLVFPYVATDPVDGKIEIFVGNIGRKAEQMGVNPQEALDSFLVDGLSSLKPLLEN
jgi:hypothetical protein